MVGKKLAHLYALVLAGGRGERFWPLSRPGQTKPFLSLGGQAPLVVATVERIQPLVPPARIFLLGQEADAELLRRWLPQIPRENLWLEPVGKNTAPAIALATLRLVRRDPQAVILVLPSDHWVRPVSAFRVTLSKLARAATRWPYLFTLGVPPSRPETGYGYIEVGPPLASGKDCYRVTHFHEKPKATRARALLGRPHVLWNSGIFGWRGAVLLEEVEVHLPALARRLKRMGSALQNGVDQKAMVRFFQAAQAISIDTGVLERSGRVATIPAQFEWDDLGSWLALERIGRRDGRGNVAHGQCVPLETHSSILYNQGDGLLATFGVTDLVVVRTPEATLVCHRSSASRLKELVERVEGRG